MLVGKPRKIQVGKVHTANTIGEIHIGKYKSGNQFGKHTGREIHIGKYNSGNDKIENTHREIQIGKYKTEKYKSDGKVGKYNPVQSTPLQHS